MDVSRREFFTRFCESVLTNVNPARILDRASDLFERAHREKSAPRSWLRPPGALPEPAFREVCTRCTACQEACPYQSIRRLGPEFGDDAGTPAIIWDESPCYLCEDMPCVAACEPLALRVETIASVAMGTAVIEEAKCYVTQGQPCDYCVARCPLKNEAIAFDAKGLPVINQEGCAGCGVCAYLCPPDAITIQEKRVL